MALKSGAHIQNADPARQVFMEEDQ